MGYAPLVEKARVLTRAFSRRNETNTAELL